MTVNGGNAVTEFGLQVWHQLIFHPKPAGFAGEGSLSTKTTIRR
jgi:hypothetical protein